ncbi:MAG TPA: hypothetical protein VEC14_08540, partial [Reyranellaceae bacterium]|nr:hypothetical protein [Reyranellaceae bacterium]
MTKLVRLILCATALLCLGAASALAQTFQAGQQIEYRRTGSLNWERGVIVRPTADGRQYVIRQKPSQFFPEGAEATYWPNELRVPQAAQAPAPQPQPTPNQPRAAPPAGPPAGPVGVGPGGLKPGDTVEYKASSWPE